jgi:hypothetical protein
MDYFGGIDPLNYVGKVAASRPYGQSDSAARANAGKEFANVFYTELMKQVLNNQGGIFGSGDESGYFGNTSQVSEIFMDQFVQEIVSAGRYDELLAAGLLKKGVNKF